MKATNKAGHAWNGETTRDGRNRVVALLRR
jgi:hypothetical protein